MISKDSRKSALLSAIIREYIESAKPVPSSLVVEKYGFDVSPATIRNEMADLEEEGLIESPHTSAGRIPTLAGWDFYIKNFLQSKELKKGDKDVLRQVIEKAEGLRNIAKSLAELSELAVFVGFSENDLYYTGLSYLFKNPEFQEIGAVCSFSQVVDHLEEMMPKIFTTVGDQTKILLGKENPFGSDCGTIATRVSSGLVGMIGPVRMDYENNLARLQFIKESLS